MIVEILSDGTKVLQFAPIEGCPFYSDWLEILLSRGTATEITCSAAAMCGACYKLGKHVFGCTEKIIETCQQTAILLPDGNSVGLICIGCGVVMPGEVHGATVRISQSILRRGGKAYKVSGAKYTAFKDFHKITIGGFVQFREDEEKGPKEIWKRWKRKPVSMSGIGCADCREKFAILEREARLNNSQRELYGQMLAEATDAKARRLAQPLLTKRCEKHRMQWCAACLSGQTTQAIEPPKIKLPSNITPFIDVFDHDIMDTE